MDYREIKIWLYTDLENEKNEKIEFTSSMLQHPELLDRKGLNRNPYISFNAMYNYAPLTELSFQQRMSFFFNTNSHPLLLSIYPQLITTNVLSNVSQNRDEYVKQMNRLIKNNVECMLQLLFIISPLNSINVTGSLEVVTERIKIPKIPTISGFFKSITNTQIMIDNNKYSFERMIWMNDLLNNPVYDSFFRRTNDGKGEKYIKFKNWLNDALSTTTIDNEIKAIFEKIENTSYEKIKDEVEKNTKMSLFYRKPGDIVDFTIYTDLINNFVMQDLGIKNISTNEFLQNIITMKDPEKFFTFLKDIYNYFYLGDTSYNNHKKELFTGVNFSREKNIHEIFVLCDLYIGEEGTLYGKENCKNKNEKLGKNLELILSQSSVAVDKNRQKWDIRYNRIIYFTPENINLPNNKDGAGQQHLPQIASRIDLIGFNRIVDEVETESKKNIDTKINVQNVTDSKYWQYDSTRSLFENINVYDGGKITPMNILNVLYSGDKNEKKFYNVINEYFKTLIRYSQTVYDKLNLLKSEFSALINNIVSRQQSSIPPLTQYEMLELNIRCAKYYLYSKIAEKLKDYENNKQKFGGARKCKKKYRTKRRCFSKKRFTRKNNYSRIS